ncbi:uncharacterized protein LOC141601159 [Silene latifolia]|uniref:uncharacterized protein LOC141601159 n=1 Tax=Silene latifolia TaxID=37657 RepID=UPI003D7858C9
MWWMSVVYGFNRATKRIPLWQSLLLMHQVVNGPWVVMGDFNSVLAMDERIGSEISVAEVRDFQKCVDACGIGDIPAQGSFFTWNNKQEVGDMVFSRIDRAMFNVEWLLKYPDTITMFHPEGLFDHCPCTMTLKPDCVRERGSFKYFNMWGKDSEFLPIVKEVWDSQIHGVKIFQLVKKLKLLKRPLKELNGFAYAQIETTAKLAQVILQDAQVKLHLDPTNLVLQKEAKEAAVLYKEREDAKRSFLGQNAKVQWAADEDGNTKYFHSQLLGTCKPVAKVHVPTVRKGKVVNDDQRQLITAGVTESEIKEALAAIPPNKAPGPDGFNSQFFKDAYEVVESDLIAAVQEIFISGRMLKHVNATTLTLIPKKSRLESVSDFRPIVCCNVVYKVISKVVCNRLARVSPSINVYSVANGYSWLQGSQVKVPWYPLIWNKVNSPKHAFIGWIAIQQKLLTKDRLLQYGIITNGRCELCLSHIETLQYILYDFVFSAMCWRHLKCWLGINMPTVGIKE